MDPAILVISNTNSAIWVAGGGEGGGGEGGGGEGGGVVGGGDVNETLVPNDDADCAMSTN